MPLNDETRLENLKAFSLDRTRALELLDGRRQRVTAANIAITGFIAALAVGSDVRDDWVIYSAAALIAVVAVSCAVICKDITKSLAVVNAVHLMAMKTWVEQFAPDLLQELRSDQRAKDLFPQAPGSYSHLDKRGWSWFGPGLWPNYLPLFVSLALLGWQLY
jgi:hypothetical protein